MKDIFGSARKVIVSLGPHDSNVFDTPPRPVYRIDWDLRRRTWKQQAMGIVRDRWYFNLVKGSQPTKEVTRLTTLMNSPWFDRVWVVQEVAFAKSLSVICG